MKIKQTFAVLVTIVLATGAARGEPVDASARADLPSVVAEQSALEELTFEKVRVNDDFWSPRIEQIQTVTIPDLLKIAEEQGKIDNLRIIAGLKTDGRIREYNSPDSDLFKIMEAAAYTLAWRTDAALDRRLDDLIGLYAAAQDDDGYINQMYMLAADHPQSPAKYRKGRYGKELRFKGTIREWAKGIGQLYCAGHMFEAAAAHYRATGKRNFLDLAIRMADCVYRRFPPGRPIDYADHPEAGIGLIKLYEVTGEKKYLALADHIVHHGHHGRPPDLGHRESWKPIEQQRKAWGHAVRIHYLYSAATDLCRYLGEPDTRQALDRLWHSIVDRRIYVTGGVGGPAPYEQLADDYVLDNARCYCECCANIAHGMWNHRLNLLSGRAKYADLVEIEAYNAGLAGLSLDGTKYFYANKLLCPAKRDHNRWAGVRQRYLFCCPSNLPRLVAGIGRWIYAKGPAAIDVNLYIGSEADIDLPVGRVKLIQTTRYPRDGQVTITVSPAQPETFDLCLRIPGWAQGRPFPGDLYRFADPRPVRWTVAVNGQTIEAPVLDKGYVRIHRKWNPGDRITLVLPMPVKRVYANEKVSYDRGRVALMRGPIVYCLEGVDHDFDVLKMVLPSSATITAEYRADLLGGVTVLRGGGLADGKRPVQFTAVPYYAWENRGIAAMTVWIVENPEQLLTADLSPIARRGT